MIRLFELRGEKGWSQRETAKLIGVSQGTYNNWENGKTQPSIEQLIELSKIFCVSVDYLIGNTDEYGTVQVEGRLTREESKILKSFQGLDLQTKEAFFKILEKIK